MQHAFFRPLRRRHVRIVRIDGLEPIVCLFPAACREIASSAKLSTDGNLPPFRWHAPAHTMYESRQPATDLHRLIGNRLPDEGAGYSDDYGRKVHDCYGAGNKRAASTARPSVNSASGPLFRWAVLFSPVIASITEWHRGRDSRNVSSSRAAPFIRAYRVCLASTSGIGEGKHRAGTGIPPLRECGP